MSWTEITRRQYRRDGLRYASNLTDEEWQSIAPHLPAAKPLGRPRETDLREAVNAMLYVLTTGCQWRFLPTDFPPYITVQRFFYRWRDDGTWRLLPLARRRHLAADQPPSPDHRGRWAARLRCGQEDQGQEASHPDRYQWVAGRGQRARGRRPGPRRGSAAAGLDPPRFPLAAPRLRRRRLCRHQAADRAGHTRHVDAGDRQASDGAKGFALLPRRWVVERTLAWLNRNRRLAKDFEALIETATAWLMLASVKLLSRRLARDNQPIGY